MENWIKVWEFNKNTENTMEWLYVILADEKIPYKEEIKEEWIGIGKYAKYKQNAFVYVPKEYKQKVEAYIKEYNNPDNVVYEESEELKNAYSDEEEEKREFQKRNIAQKILILTPFVMVAIVILCGIISSIIY